MSYKVIVGDGTGQRLAELEARAAHEAAMVAEETCPVHKSRMHPVDMGEADLVAGHCSPCGKYWWYDLARGEIGSMLDHDPKTYTWQPPARPGRRP